VLKFTGWRRWQGEALYDRMRKRTPAGRSKPIALAFIAIATNLDDDDGDFERFARLVGGGILARGYLIAILGYIGRDSATTGCLRCERTQLGPVVLTDRTGHVSAKIGATVYDALVTSGIAVEISPSDVQDIPLPSRECGPPSSREVSEGSSREASGTSSGEDVPPSSGRRGEERREEEIPPLCPPGGKAEGNSASHTSGERDGAAAASAPATNGHVVPPDDLAVLRTLAQQRARLVINDQHELDRLMAGLREGKPDVAGILAFNDRLTPKFVDRVEQARRVFRMAANARKSR